LALKKRRFSVEQIVGVLKQADVGVPVAELIRKVGISEQTFYRWKKQYVDLESDQVHEMKQLQDASRPTREDQNETPREAPRSALATNGPAERVAKGVSGILRPRQ
jgi:putative transposase